MVRKNIYDILHSVKFELEIEYERLFSSFYDTDDVYLDYSINQLAKDNFGKFSQLFIGRCTSIDDFNKTYEFNFKRYPTELDLNYFLLFCEYAYNICIELQEVCHQRDKIKANRLANNILECIDILGYKEIEKERISIFVEASPEALAVAEIVDEELSFRVLEYNHHKLKGAISAKKSILLQLGNLLEANKKVIKQINNDLEMQIFYLLNTLNLRHNNVEAGSKNYKQVVAEMSQDELEGWYDELYQLCLIAILELDNVERKRKVNELKKKIEK